MNIRILEELRMEQRLQLNSAIQFEISSAALVDESVPLPSQTLSDTFENPDQVVLRLRAITAELTQLAQNSQLAHAAHVALTATAAQAEHSVPADNPTDAVESEQVCSMQSQPSEYGPNIITEYRPVKIP